MNNNIKLNKWSEYNYKLNNSLMTPYQLLKALALFRAELLQYVSSDYSII